MRSGTKRGMIIAGGIIYAFVSIFHLLLWKGLNWPETLICLTNDNRAMVQVLNLHVAYTTALFAFISFSYSKQMISTPLGKTLALAIGLFTILRAINQVIFWPLDMPSVIIILIMLMRSFLYIGPLVIPNRAT